VDTNNSAADFAPSAPNPEANAGNLGTMTCQPFTGTGGSGGASVKDLKAKVKGNGAVVTGRIDPPAPGEKVSLTFFANGSPLRKIAKKTATLNDQSRFRRAFRVPAESTRCKVKVRFRGAMVGQKRFRC
jgi:hypothetical protein